MLFLKIFTLANDSLPRGNRKPSIFRKWVVAHASIRNQLSDLSWTAVGRVRAGALDVSNSVNWHAGLWETSRSGRRDRMLN